MASDETPPTESGTFMPPFERPLSIYKVLYDDDVESMKLSLPELMDKCKLSWRNSSGQELFKPATSRLCSRKQQVGRHIEPKCI